MKKLLLTLVAALVAVAANAQTGGGVQFANTSSTLIRTNNTPGATYEASAGNNILGAGNYRFALYMGTVGSAEGSLTLVGVATNGALAGRFSGGNPFQLPDAYQAGNTYAFQVRGWAVASGQTFEAAEGALGNVGRSAIGQVTPGQVGGPNPVFPALFGTGPGQVGGFVITPIPEPSSIALGLLGLGAIALFRRRK
jgi:hypothetical protein